MWFRIVLLLLLGGPALADEIRLANGDRITAYARGNAESDHVHLDADFTARVPGRVSTDSTLLLGVDYAF
jgi:hypothetical protein